MKKLLSIMLVILVLTTLLASCGTPVNTNLDTDTNTDTTSDTSQEPVDTSIKVEYDAKREASDNEFPFESIIIEPKSIGGYDLVAAGEYYGNDFDNVKYYGSYYRIIDNYNDFSQLTQWGNKIDESVFEGYSIIVLHSYRNQFLYHTEHKDANGPGGYSIYRDAYSDFNIEESTGIGYSPEDLITCDNCYLYPTIIRETKYLILPKSEIAEGTPYNGEVKVEYDMIVFYD